MKSLDRFCAKRFPFSAVLTREMVLTWMEDSSGSHGSECTVRGSVIRKFAMYMNGIGGAAYVLPEKMYGHTNAFVPYIFTDDELIRLFAAIDRISPSAAQPYKQEVLPVMFRLIYTCGLRPAEARTLKTENIYLDSGEVLQSETRTVSWSKPQAQIHPGIVCLRCHDGYFSGSLLQGIGEDSVEEGNGTCRY